MRSYRVYYMGDRSVVWDDVNADGFDVFKDSTLLFYQNKTGQLKRHFAAYREWYRVEEI